MVSALFMFVALAVISSTATKLLNKYVIKETEPYAFAIVTNTLSTIIFFILALSVFKLPKEPIAWVIMGFAAVLWSLIAVFIFYSYKSAEVSIRDPLSQSKIVIALILGTVFLGETLTTARIIGTAVIFFGISTLVYHPERRFGRLSEPGVKWTFFTAFLGAVVAIVDKAALQYFNLETYGFMVYFFPAVILGLLLPKRIGHVKHLLKIRWKSAVAAIILSTAAYYFTLKSFSLADVTLVYPFLQLATLFTVLGGIVFMKEREHFWQKIIAVVLVVAGAIILKL